MREEGDFACPQCGKNLDAAIQSHLKEYSEQAGHEDEGDLSDHKNGSEKPFKLETLPGVSVTENGVTDTGSKQKSINLRPALRGFVTQWIIVSLGLFVALFPITSITLIMPNFDINALNDWPWALQGIKYMGLAAVLYYGSQVLVAWLGNRYKLGDYNVETAEGIIARNKSNVRYSHIRSVEIKQGFVDRLLDVGAVELATAGSSEVEIIFKGVANPAGIQDEVNRRILISQNGRVD